MNWFAATCVYEAVIGALRYVCAEFFVLQQEALLKLGFYSGEEDMEYSSFSSGTERAVKTWQVSPLLHNI